VHEEIWNKFSANRIQESCLPIRSLCPASPHDEVLCSRKGDWITIRCGLEIDVTPSLVILGVVLAASKIVTSDIKVRKIFNTFTGSGSGGGKRPRPRNCCESESKLSEWNHGVIVEFCRFYASLDDDWYLLREGKIANSCLIYLHSFVAFWIIFQEYMTIINTEQCEIRQVDPIRQDYASIEKALNLKHHLPLTKNLPYEFQGKATLESSFRHARISFNKLLPRTGFWLISVMEGESAGEARYLFCQITQPLTSWA